MTHDEIQKRIVHLQNPARTLPDAVADIAIIADILEAINDKMATAEKRIEELSAVVRSLSDIHP